MKRIGRIGWMLALLALLAQGGIANATPESGWWWNPSESGRGFFVENQNGVVYIAGYFYDSDGRATWMVSGSANADPYNYTGRLTSLSDGQTMFGDYKLPGTPTDAGEVTLQFSDDTHGTITWPGGTIPIVRQIFGSGAPSFDVDNGWWWNPEESGRGYTLERQGDTLVVAGFMYDEAGKPVWYLSAGPMSSPTTYSGPWLRFANGQTMTGPYQPPTAPVTAGKLDIEFTATNEATMTFESPAAAPASTRDIATKAGKVIKVPVKRQFPAKGSDPANSYVGGFTYRTKHQIQTENGLSVVNLTYKSTDLVWRAAGDLVLLDLTNGPWLAYFPVGGKIVVEYSDSSIYVDHAFGGSVDCQTPLTVFEFPADATTGMIAVNRYGQFKQGYIWKQVEFTTNMKCVATKKDGKQVHTTVPITHSEYRLSLDPIQGTMQYKAILGKIPEHEWYPGLPFTPVSSAEYYFEASSQ